MYIQPVYKENGQQKRPGHINSTAAVIFSSNVTNNATASNDMRKASTEGPALEGGSTRRSSFNKKLLRSVDKYKKIISELLPQLLDIESLDTDEFLSIYSSKDR